MPAMSTSWGLQTFNRVAFDLTLGPLTLGISATVLAVTVGAIIVTDRVAHLILEAL